MVSPIAFFSRRISLSLSQNKFFLTQNFRKKGEDGEKRRKRRKRGYRINHVTP